MYQIIKKANYDLKDITDFIEKLGKLPSDFFDKDAEIFVTRAPGRLDVMGGIADYSGSLVLEMPIAEATFTAIQKTDKPILHILSQIDGQNLIFEMPLADFTENQKTIEYSKAREYFNRVSSDHWAAYIAGVFLVLMREKRINFEQGANIFIFSTIPQGKGVSSSAALEASVMSAVAALFEIQIEPREMALLCQKVENLVVGAPCGIMDQMTVICGGENELLSMICQPAELNSSVRIPEEIEFWGIDSGIRHAVVGADYGTVRTGAFIGYRIIAECAGFKIDSKNGIKIADKNWNGYLANIQPEVFEKEFRDNLPETISGVEFINKYNGITDRVTKVSVEKEYPVLYPTAHPIFENARVEKFAKLLNRKITESVLETLGGLMFEAHESYSKCGLGSHGTDLLVELVKEFGVGKGLYGAKITGGGSGGTVAVLARRGMREIIEEIAVEYAKRSGHQPYIFEGTSPGVAAFGYLKLNYNE